mmetsp:Transcript_15863/g.60421  ORF Transcript_15863/g.60421 Transcript_15863/m.60421 type:complete len:266 (-) Transcript_15863:941-1738(-)
MAWAGSVSTPNLLHSLKRWLKRRTRAPAERDECSPLLYADLLYFMAAHCCRVSFKSVSDIARCSTSATSASESLPSLMKSRMFRMGSAPRAATSGASCRGRWDTRIGSLPQLSPDACTFSASAVSASRSFIFMYGQVAQPPAVLQPSPAGTPGTTCRSPSTALTASAATGKMISTSTPSPASPPVRRVSCTPFTMEDIMPLSVPKMNLTDFADASPSARRCAASLDFSVMKLKMFEVDPTAPRPRALASMASSNISPGTSRCAVT